MRTIREVRYHGIVGKIKEIYKWTRYYNHLSLRTYLSLPFEPLDNFEEAISEYNRRYPMPSTQDTIGCATEVKQPHVPRR